MDYKAKKLREVFREMKQTCQREVKMYRMNKHLIEDAADFFNDLEAMKKLRKRIQAEINKDANSKRLLGIFETFPNGRYPRM